MAEIIHVQNLKKYYSIPIRGEGLKESIRSLFFRQMREVRAIDDISFSLEEGEIVGFLGPNGAGKTSTLKTLSGLLHPSGGEVKTLGYVPWQREPNFLRQITLVMGNRNQLQWDIPALDSFELNRAIYNIPRAQFVQLRDELMELLELKDLAQKPIRNLSLGERMKMELVGSLLHQPKILFLDEPTLGLDVSMQRKIREFIAEYNRRYGAAVLLTSHYMADVEALCKRVIIIHHGKIIFTGGLTDLANRFSSHKTITITFIEAPEHIEDYGEITERNENTIKMRVNKNEIAAVSASLFQKFQISDITIEEPPIEDVIDTLFSAKDQMLEQTTDGIR